MLVFAKARKITRTEIRLAYYRHAFLTTGPFCPYQKCWPCDLDLDFWPTFEKNLTLAITFEPKEIRLSYYTCWFLVTRPFCLYQKNWPCNLDLDFWDRAFIFQMCISSCKTFLLEPKFFTSWPWPWLLTYFWKKNLTLTIAFEPKVIGI